MRICLILEGCYPYVHGGVSTWMHQYIKEMKEHEFVLWVIGAHAEDKGKFVYELPENVVEVKEVFLDDALHVKDTGKLLHIFTREEQDSLRELMDCGRPDWEVLFRLYHDKKINPMSFLKSPGDSGKKLSGEISVYCVCRCISHDAVYAASGTVSSWK